MPRCSTCDAEIQRLMRGVEWATRERRGGRVVVGRWRATQTSTHRCSPEDVTFAGPLAICAACGQRWECDALTIPRRWETWVDEAMARVEKLDRNPPKVCPTCDWPRWCACGRSYRDRPHDLCARIVDACPPAPCVTEPSVPGPGW